MNALVISGIRGTTIATVILISSIFSGTYFNNQHTTNCDNHVDFENWLSTDQHMLPISVDISIDLAFSDYIGMYDEEYISNEYLSVFPNNTHNIVVMRYELDTWVENFLGYEEIFRPSTDEISIKSKQIMSRNIDGVVVQNYIFELRKQLSELFTEDLHVWDWNQVIANGHTDNEYRQISVHMVNTDGSAISLLFQENGIMFSGEYADFFNSNGEISREDVQYYIHGLNSGYSYSTGSCQVYYQDIDNFEQVIQSQFLQYMAGYISSIL